MCGGSGKMEKVKLQIDEHPVHGFYIIEGNHPCHYLHKDGVVRYSTFNDDTNRYDGYYKTREEAQKVIDGLYTFGSIFSALFKLILGSRA